MSNELKNCPFCGGKPEFYYPFHLMGKPGSAAKYHAGVRCPQCRCESRATTPPDDAIAAWNTRTEQRMSDAVRDVLEKMFSALLIAEKFCGQRTSDECDDSIAIPISEAVSAARKHGIGV